MVSCLPVDRSDTILDEHETQTSPTQPVIELEYIPAYILVKMNSTKIPMLEGLEQGVLPLVPLERTFNILHQRCDQTMTPRLRDSATYILNGVSSPVGGVPISMTAAVLASGNL